MAAQISSEQAYAYAELLEILSFIDIDLVSKIPYKLMHIFQKYASTSYGKHLEKSIPLDKQNISPKTAALIALLSLNYWCESDEEKIELKSILNENEKIKEQKLREKYNPDNIFKNNNTVKKDSLSTPDNNSKPSTNLPIDCNTLPWYKKLYLSFKTYLFKILKK